jgi:hypothetical protein
VLPVSEKMEIKKVDDQTHVMYSTEDMKTLKRIGTAKLKMERSSGD